MWTEVGDRIIEGPDFIKEVEDKIAEIRENLKAAQSARKVMPIKEDVLSPSKLETMCTLKFPQFAAHVDSRYEESWLHVTLDLSHVTSQFSSRLRESVEIYNANF